MPENPYAPPTAANEPRPAPESHGWEVRGDYVFVKEGALLPMVDPYNGRSEDCMTMHRMKLRQIRSFTFVIFPRSVSFQLFITAETAKREKNQHIFIAIGGICGFALYFLPAFRSNLPPIFITLLIIIAFVILKQSTRRRLVCKKRLGPHFEIRGVHPDAMTYLRELQLKRSNSARSAAPSHTGESRSQTAG